MFLRTCFSYPILGVVCTSIFVFGTHYKTNKIRLQKHYINNLFNSQMLTMGISAFQSNPILSKKHDYSLITPDQKTTYIQIDKIPTELTKEELQEFLDSTKSGIEIKTFKALWNPKGCNNDNFYQFEINGEYILRIAIADKANIPREKDLIEKLNKTNFVILPNYIHVSKDGSIGIYKKVQGSTLTKEKYISLTENEQNNLAQKLASFFFHVHNLYSIEEAENTLGILDETTQVLKGIHKRVPDATVTEKDLEDLIKINANKPPEEQIPLPDHQFKELIKVVVSGYKKIYKDPAFQALLHNDAHGKHIKIDEEMNVYLDEPPENMAIGDICRDPRFLYAIDFDLPDKVYKFYAEKSGIDAQDLQLRSAYHIGYKELSNLLKILKTPEIAIQEDFEVPDRLIKFMETEHYQKMLEDYLDFLPVLKNGDSFIDIATFFYAQRIRLFSLLCFCSNSSGERYPKKECNLCLL